MKVFFSQEREDGMFKDSANIVPWIRTSLPYFSDPNVARGQVYEVADLKVDIKKIVHLVYN
jgi:hypothetical protein